ncbi:MAG: hypothetical protein O2819_07875 [Planctomycetota bacterium]|nr:hypothetical protein [Planctomycetota bacterium]MDA1106176.1 hypothetical protein [Planctomycetota bacterium]
MKVPFFAVGLLAAALLPACTTDLSSAVKAFDRGEFSLAGEEINKSAPTNEKGGVVVGIKVEHKKDELWVSLQKVTMLADAGRFQESNALAAWVFKQASQRRSSESWYARNPADPANWDASQFLQDAGQAVMGADQTNYELQPYELILLESYSALNHVLAGEGAVDTGYGASIAKLQDDEGNDLRIAGLNPAEAPMGAMDAAVAKKLPGGASSDFSARKIFSLGKFPKAKKALSDAIDRGRALGAGDPRVAWGSVMRWMMAMVSRDNVVAAATAGELLTESKAAGLAAAMKQLSSAESQPFVLVLADVGRGPQKSWFDIRLPIIIPGVGSGTFRAVYPALQFRTDDRPNRVEVVGSRVNTMLEIVTSIDAIAARNFRRREGNLWWVPTVRAAIRTIATIVGQAVQDKDDSTTRGIIALTGILVGEAEQPDERCWSTLPAEQWAAIVPVPADGKVRIKVTSASGSREVVTTVGKGASVVYIRALTPETTIVRSVPLAIAGLK